MLQPGVLVMSDIRQTAIVASLLTLGALGGGLAYVLGLPMPFMLGSLLFSAVISIAVTLRTGQSLPFPLGLRKTFIAVIGVMIGATFSPEVLVLLPRLWPSLLAMMVFVVISYAIAYAVFRRLGGFDAKTALFAALPGGLIEAISLGEQAGVDTRILTVQHFTRVILVVVTVLNLFWLWSGHAVGSAAGQSFTRAVPHLIDVILIAALALAGIWLGKRLRLPASHMIGPLVLSALVHALGLAQVISPDWLLFLAQLVVGTGLGTLFSGTGLGDLGRAFGLGLVTVSVMLALGLGIALALAHYLPVGADALFISYAPGGVTEMGLIALSLGISPVLVAAHHLFRITFAVSLLGWLSRRMSL